LLPNRRFCAVTVFLLVRFNLLLYTYNDVNPNKWKFVYSVQGKIHHGMCHVDIRKTAN